MFTNHNITAADLYDIYKRALIHNNEFVIIKNDHKVSEEKYNQTFSSIFPDINLTATSNKTEIHRYDFASVYDFGLNSYFFCLIGNFNCRQNLDVAYVKIKQCQRIRLHQGLIESFCESRSLISVCFHPMLI